MIQAGLDIARMGEDKSVYTIRDGYKILLIERWAKADTIESADRVEHLQRIYNPQNIVIDADGLGAGVFDVLRQRGLPVTAFHGSSKTDRKDDTGELGFLNLRSYAWWNARQLLDPSKDHNLIMPKDDDLIGDLCAPRWRVISGSRIQIESKDDVKKRLGRSPDAGDSFCYCLMDMEPSKYEEGFTILGGRDIDRINNPAAVRKQEAEIIDIAEIDPREFEKLLWANAHNNHGFGW